MMKTQALFSPIHVAIIMDGNGRWARSRSLPRVAGHRSGGEAVRRIVEAAPDLGIATLTLFAFSQDNWKRPQREVAALMRLFETHLAQETRRGVENGVRVRVIGRRDRLPRALVRAIQRTEHATRHGERLLLRLAVDYSARHAILEAASRIRDRRPISREDFSALLCDAADGGEAPDVDLLIRTGGEQRLSDFLLWECAYAELLFIAKQWPDFERADLEAAVAEFRGRERRFGAVPAHSLAG